MEAYDCNEALLRNDRVYTVECEALKKAYLSIIHSRTK
jgi:hypothetical protein